MNTKYIVTFLYAPFGSNSKIDNVHQVIGEINGVKNVEINKHVKSIVDIEYDPELVSSSAIVSQIKKQGAQVSLIAM